MRAGCCRMCLLVIHEYATGDVLHQPVDPRGEASACDGAARLYPPMSLGRGQLIEPELLADLLCAQCTIDVLLVGEDKQRGAGEALREARSHVWAA